MEAICERSNMESAIKRVIKNKGAPGVDGMTVRKVKRYLKLDKELQKRGLCFVRYADDCVIFVRSKRAGDRVMQSVNSGCVKLVWKHWPPARREGRAYASERKTAKPVYGNS